MAITSLFDGDKLGAYQSGLSVTRGSITGPASYATGGFVADIATDLGIASSSIVGPVLVQNDSGYRAIWSSVNDKVYVFAVDSTLQLAALTNLAGVTFYLTVFHNAG